jgi:hypothetical protein
MVTSEKNFSHLSAEGQKRDPKVILRNLWKRNRLGPFYIIRPPILTSDSPSKLLEMWLDDFLSEILYHQRKISQEEARELLEVGVSDFYLIKKDEGDREFKVNSQAVSDFIKAHAYPPLELPHKIIAVFQAEDLNLQVANKWLKTLEEPQEKITTLFLTTSNKALLSTLESRAITLRILPEDKAASKNLADPSCGSFAEFITKEVSSRDFWLHIASDKQLEALESFSQDMRKVHLILDQLKYSAPLAQELFELCHNYVTLYCHESRVLAKWLEEIQWFRQAQTFNNAPAERFVGLFHLIQQVDAHR